MSDIIRVRAPVRLDLAGGWTDVPPFSAERGGAVVNLTFGLYTTVELAPLESDTVTLEAPDLGQTITVSGPDELPKSGSLALVSTAVRQLVRSPGVRLRVASEAPVGAGLGGSGSLGVALVHATELLAGGRSQPADLAERAYQLESAGAGNPGGRQDQCAAAFGGINHFTFEDPDLTADGIAAPEGFLDELAGGLIVCYLGESRVSGRTIARVMAAYRSGRRGVADTLTEMRRLADDMAVALTDGDIERVAQIMDLNWQGQIALDDQMRTEAMATLEQAMRRAGAIAAKAAGAGAGGSMMFLAPGKTDSLREVAAEHGATVLDGSLAVPGVGRC